MKKTTIFAAICMLAFTPASYAAAGDFELSGQDKSLKSAVQRWVALEGRKVVWNAPDFVLNAVPQNAVRFAKSSSASESIEQLFLMAQRDTRLQETGLCGAGDVGYLVTFYEKGEVAVVVTADVRMLDECKLQVAR